MRLTAKENDELLMLIERQKSRTIPMLPEQFGRMVELRNKELHNCCTNPRCTGYEGTEHEIHCDSCGRKLYKQPKN